MRIDAHTHGMHADRNEAGQLIPPVRPIWDGSLMSPEEYVKKMNAEGIEAVLVLDPPDITFKLKELFGDFVIPAPQVDLEKTSPDEIKELFQRGAAGIKFIAPGKPYGDDAYLPIYDAVQSYKGLAVFHTGYLATGVFEPGCAISRDFIVDITHMSPLTMDRVARACPELKILMAHYGNPSWEEAWKMTKSHKNIYADFSGGTAKTRDLEMWRQIFAPNGNLDIKAVEKLCYASDVEYFTEDYGFEKQAIEFYEKLFDFLKVPAPLREKVYRENILSLLKA